MLCIVFKLILLSWTWNLFWSFWNKNENIHVPAIFSIVWKVCNFVHDCALFICAPNLTKQDNYFSSSCPVVHTVAV